MSQPERKEVRIFNAALELPATERAAWLDQACAGDAAVRRQVEALLQACGEADDFFKTALDPQPRPSTPPTQHLSTKSGQGHPPVPRMRR